MTTVAQLVVDAIRTAGIDTLYCIPGIQNDDFFDRLVDAADIRPVVCRHEQGTAYLALGAAQVTGRASACCVVPGPGLLNAGAALTTAYWGGTRVLAVVGEIPTRLRGRNTGTLHELPDQHAIVTQLTKHAELVVDPATAAAQIQTAIDELVGGAAHPVGIEVPADVWSKPADGAINAPVPAEVTLDDRQVDEAARLLAGARRPLIVVGSGAYDATAEVLALAELLQAPVTTRRMGHGVVPTDHPLFVPLTVAHDLWSDVDVCLGIGSRVEWPIDVWGVDDDLAVIHVDIDPAGLDRHGIGAHGVLGDAATATAAITEAVRAIGVAPPARAADLAARSEALADELSRSLAPQVGFLRAIRDVLPDDGVLVEDVTQIGFAAHLAFPFHQPRTFLSSGPAGTLGSAVGMGIGAADAARDRTVLTVTGDGGFLFGATELATAVQHDIPAKVVVFDDGAYGNVKRIQTQRFGADRTIASTLHNPDFVALARSFGVWAGTAEGPDGLRVALADAFAHPGPALVTVPVGEMPDPWPFLRLRRARPLR